MPYHAPMFYLRVILDSVHELLTEIVSEVVFNGKSDLEGMNIAYFMMLQTNACFCMTQVLVYIHSFIF